MGTSEYNLTLDICTVVVLLTGALIYIIMMNIEDSELKNGRGIYNHKKYDTANMRSFDDVEERHPINEDAHCVLEVPRCGCRLIHAKQL